MAIEQSIFNGIGWPNELKEYQYRKLFHLTAEEYDNEPADRLYTNLFIHAQIQEKKRIEAKNG